MDKACKADVTFAKALPKAEIHAHLSGSISRECMYELWLRRMGTKPRDTMDSKEAYDLESPLTALNPGGNNVDITTFFPLFDKYIYKLVDNALAVEYATQHVIYDFAHDGVKYLELRTTPRENMATGLTKEAYVSAVIETMCMCNQIYGDDFGDDCGIEVNLILSIDRKMTAEQAIQVVDLAILYSEKRNCPYCSGKQQAGRVVGIDLCGNPTNGDVRIFTPAFQKAKSNGLGITVHFAEVPESGTDIELETLLSWEPDRLGHVIHVPEQFKQIIRARKLGLELCLSCNVLAKMTPGGIADHHFTEWIRFPCHIALSTDDVGIFDSTLSNEYLLAAQHFDLGREELSKLSRSAVDVAFAGRERMLRLLERFEHALPIDNDSHPVERDK